jgi:hypothetical protein
MRPWDKKEGTVLLPTPQATPTHPAVVLGVVIASISSPLSMVPMDLKAVPTQFTVLPFQVERQ